MFASNGACSTICVTVATDWLLSTVFLHFGCRVSMVSNPNKHFHAIMDSNTQPVTRQGKLSSAAQATGKTGLPLLLFICVLQAQRISMQKWPVSAFENGI
ncbi:hypothetical protein CEXT_626201 [Caerostris extrusa]|uniref:Secreted protein n=1 Tax=Caerostris extrusa TaxID=172846 RepID=A0AAV4U834_CAEEX|nr:hypothetical protein CEXT_626201 [Caerostris extrusa]